MTPNDWLLKYQKKYPLAFSQADRFRAGRGKGMPDWADWCYLPVAASYAIISGGGPNTVPPHLGQDIGTLAALLAWRPNRIELEIDRPLLGALLEQPVDEAVTKGDLVNLPRWCPYVRMHGTMGLKGFWIHLEHDARDGHAELRFLLNEGRALQPLPIDLGGTLEEGARSVASEALRVADRTGQSVPFMPGYSAAYAELVRPLVSVAAYLASDKAEFDPKIPAPAEGTGRHGIYHVG